MSEHTPGPWRPEKLTEPEIDIVTDRDMIIASVWIPVVGGTQQANAHLIAAAPEMKALLQELYDDPNVRMNIAQQKRTIVLLAKTIVPPAPPHPSSESDQHGRT